MCKVLKVGRSSFYSWLNREPSNRHIENQHLVKAIIQVHQTSKQTYGSPRIRARLVEMGYKVSRPRVARLMRSSSIRSITKKKYRVTTDSKHKFKIAKNLLDRNFTPGTIGKTWVSDITYIRTKAGWAYLTTIIDLGDRKVIGWNLSASLKTEKTIIPAWNMAIRKRPIREQLIFHSDRGIQYACDEFRKALSNHSTIKQSMSRKGNCWDNAVAESFFKTLKSEWSNRFVYQSISHAEISMFEYIEAYYNTTRLHSALGYMSPDQYSMQFITNQKAA